VLIKEKPDVIISSGAAVAVPFFYIGKLLRAKTIYVEVFDRMDKPTVTGKLVYPVTDKFIVQWPEMTKVYPKAEYFGSLF
jgi:UDP-N-acetylglucosamine:LPS N-acetylglucosamine transferase